MAGTETPLKTPFYSYPRSRVAVRLTRSIPLYPVPLSLSVRVVASTAPPVALVLGFVLVFSGIASGNTMMVSAGWVFVAVGVALQLAYLLTRYLVATWVSSRARNRVPRTFLSEEFKN